MPDLEWFQGIPARHEPASFAVVMATGIVSLAAQQQGFTVIAWVLYWINVGLYALLLMLSLARVAFHRHALAADLGGSKNAGFFTIVAGTCVLGSQSVVIAGAYTAAIGLWFAGLVLWFIVTYGFLAVTMTRQAKPGLQEGIDGSWLLAVVGTQAVAYLGALVAVRFGPALHEVLLLCLALWLSGHMLYTLIILLIFYRLAFFSITPDTLTASYWINMGALAITTVAGARLILDAHLWAALHDLLPFLKGFTLVFWAGATWWIPLLLILGVWRHFQQGHPFSYHVQYWSIVFPVGMYTVSTSDLATSLHIAFLRHIPQYSVYIALVAWLLVAGGMVSGMRRVWEGRRA
ncbi:MAG: tellurite resistance/C4-dicarboxylate transporter family protein [Chloroflexota bacterium]